ncbi:hypothetical protein DH2020_000351 [Rehmannia glutinosa]|uniref:AT-hook motif nuclear-localized protein n=1 Tax=Rehmannia glutinosa TaxID=99300 RepID=A0ABR0XWF0_REHGL
MQNIVERIWSFSQKIPESICILSASGTISSAELYIPASRGGRVFNRVSNGSHTYGKKGVAKFAFVVFNWQILDGRFYGGAVAGSLIARVPTTLIIATFKQNLRKQPTVRPQRLETPKPNKGTVTAPPQAESSKQAAAAEGKVVATA